MGFPYGNYDKRTVKAIILNEGLLYAVTSYMDETTISPKLTMLRSNWVKARADIDFLQDFFSARGLTPATLIFKEGEYKIIVDPPNGTYREIPMKEFPYMIKHIDKIDVTLKNILKEVGLSSNDFGNNFSKGGIVS